MSSRIKGLLFAIVLTGVAAVISSSFGMQAFKRVVTAVASAIWGS